VVSKSARATKSQSKIGEGFQTHSRRKTYHTRDLRREIKARPWERTSAIAKEDITASRHLLTTKPRSRVEKKMTKDLEAWQIAEGLYNYL